MSRLRSRTSAAVAAWPAVPVIYRRPVLRTISSILLLGLGAWDVSMIWDPPQSDYLLASDWHLGPVIFLMFAAFHLFASSSLRMTATHVELINPLRRVSIPLSQITGTEAGTNLRVDTAYGRFYAWGVEAASAQVALDSYGTQGDLVTLINEVAADATSDEAPRARYRFNWPDPLFLLVALVIAVDAIALATTGPVA